ncbi:hypothetical protein M404DRAFT_943108 [Pisolithus tinctorius Marx 270]|uniref:Uncharacterized protein n=1 Tax=Pisolithus tinctorius Marx 270 TaxID=870435 RepID=A0A0C3KAK9_PISTI|nr:hypothetical protein M404DRAFT_943108 [Pisolithus tinctorius Marx 270]
MEPESEWACTMDLDNLKSQALFTGTRDEGGFFLASAVLDLGGLEGLALFCPWLVGLLLVAGLAFVLFPLFPSVFSGLLLASRGWLLVLGRGCDPDVFYHCVRPWFCGQVSDSAERMWKFEGIDKCQDGLEEPTNVSGPSAKQTALIHALDIFLGLNSGLSETTPTSGKANARTHATAKDADLHGKTSSYLPSTPFHQPSSHA